MKRDHMVLAARMESNVLDDYHVVVTCHFGKRSREDILRCLIVSGKELTIGMCDTFRCVEQSLALGIVAGPPYQRAHSIFRLLLVRVFAGSQQARTDDDGMHGNAPEIEKRRRYAGSLVSDQKRKDPCVLERLLHPTQAGLTSAILSSVSTIASGSGKADCEPMWLQSATPGAPPTQ
jgi:hypothetical protein